MKTTSGNWEKVDSINGELFVVYSNKFLSTLPYEYGSCSWDISLREGVNKCDATLYLRDCYRDVSLEFGFKDDVSFKHRTQKIDNLIKELKDFRSQMVAAMDMSPEYWTGKEEDECKLLGVDDPCLHTN